MTTSFEAFLADANAEFDTVATKKDGEYARKQFTCEACNGTGLWSARRANRYGNTKCNACNGLGYFVTSKAERLKAQQQRAARKAAQLREAVQGNIDTGLVEELGKMSDWNDFARSLMDQHVSGRAWSANQIAAAERMVAKVAAKRAEKAAAKAERAVSVDLSAIVEMFNAATLSGYKKPMYRANGLRIKPGKGGALYVLTEDRMELGHFGEQPGYEGKIADGQFVPAKACEPTTAAKLQAIAADPKGEAIRHGQRTGRCSCCGRELTKHTSIEAGTGPICAEKWGL